MSRFLQRLSFGTYAKNRCFSLKSSKAQESDPVVVETPDGKLRGTSQRSCLGDDYYAFKGIPYAKPPVGQLRFQDPQPVESWSGVRDAMSHASVSLQFDMITKKRVGSEDCLYLNVYTRNLDATAKAAVMVWIHGGAFVRQSGNDNFYGPDYLISKNVVLITFNYRLGIFGFLNLEDEASSGNQGIKDQFMALQWVRNNISNFGGDPDNVTVFGFSAGAASIQYLSMSPVSKGLFQRAICQSGTATSVWASAFEPRRRVYDYLALLGSSERSPRKIVDFLLSVDCHTLIEVQEKMSVPMLWFQNYIPFCVRLDDNPNDPCLPGISIEASKRGIQVPLIFGGNSNEGIFYSDFLRHLDMTDLDRNLHKYLHPRILKSLELWDMSLDDLRKLYFNGERISQSNVDKVIKMCGDLYITNDVHQLANIQMVNGAAPTYFYKFTFDKNLTLYKKQRRTSFTGANHGEELTYLFRMNVCKDLGFEQLQEGTGGDRIMRQMVEMWTNFAKTGKPIPVKSSLLPVDWQPLSKGSHVDCLNIDEQLSMQKVSDVDIPLPGPTSF